MRWNWSGDCVGGDFRSGEMRCSGIDNRQLLSTNISSTCPHNMANFGPLMAEIGSGVWGTRANFSGFTSCLRYCSDITHRRPTKLCMMFGRLLGCYTIYTFSGALIPWQNFAQCRIHFTSQVLHSSTLAALLHGTPAAGVSQTLQHGTRKGITELSQWAPPIFGRVAITLGISPHSSFFSLLHCFGIVCKLKLTMHLWKHVG